MTLEDRQASTRSVDDHLDSLLRIQDEDDGLEDMTLEERIADVFADALRDELSANEWDQMKRDRAKYPCVHWSPSQRKLGIGEKWRNASGPDGICSVHDGIDANWYMYETIEAETSTAWFDAQTKGEYTKDFCELWDKSWEMFRDKWLS
mgnify:CR=1 FL=1|jgi:hypothetical protein